MLRCYLQQEERFRGNLDHSEALRDCADQKDPSCMAAHLAEECLLEGLPIVNPPKGATSEVNDQSVNAMFSVHCYIIMPSDV